MIMLGAVVAHYTTAQSAIQVLSDHVAALYRMLDAMAKGGRANIVTSALCLFPLLLVEAAHEIQARDLKSCMHPDF